MTADPRRPSAVHQVALTVEDLERAVAFYRDVVGLTYLFSAPPGMAFFDCGGTRILLGTRAAGGDDPPRSMVYYRTDDIQDAAGRLAANGVDVGKGPAMIANVGGREIWLLEFRDSEGNPVALMMER